MSENNAALKEALSTAKAHAGQSSTEAEIRMPVNIPVSYKNKTEGDGRCRGHHHEDFDTRSAGEVVRQ